MFSLHFFHHLCWAKCVSFVICRIYDKMLGDFEHCGNLFVSINYAFKRFNIFIMSSESLRKREFSFSISILSTLVAYRRVLISHNKPHFYPIQAFPWLNGMQIFCIPKNWRGFHHGPVAAKLLRQTIWSWNPKRWKFAKVLFGWNKVNIYDHFPFEWAFNARHLKRQLNHFPLCVHL